VLFLNQDRQGFFKNGKKSNFENKQPVAAASSRKQPAGATS
jgi:hypothetical protein